MGITTAGMIDDAVSGGAKKFGESAVSRTLNGIIDFVKKKYGEGKVYLGSSFDRYLDNAQSRYNQVRTLATGDSPRSIIGENSIYEEIDLKYGETAISTHSSRNIVSVSNNVLIQGTGGIGKSMLMRYLFIETLRSGDYVPVLLELRRISNQEKESISIFQLIYDCLADFDIDLDQTQFEYSLRSGNYMFLMDGFDEIKDELSKKAAEEIQKFCSKYPDNPCIITSRPHQNTSPLETFSIMNSMPLTKGQAISLASKIWNEDEKTRAFCKQLDEELYENHKDFAENPLLLSMMFLTFMRNSSIPDHLSDFYQQAFDALYSKHDSNDKGYFQRDFKCKVLDESEFKLLFSHFCFKTYFKQIYEFTEESIIEYIANSITKLKELEELQNKTINPKDYLSDLINALCMIIKDGNVYRFSHRSFQAYFAAYRTKQLPDQTQKRFYKDQLSGEMTYFNQSDYYILAYQLDKERFPINALEEKLREILSVCKASNNPEITLQRYITRKATIHGKDDYEQLSYQIAWDKDGSCYSFNVLDLFKLCFMKPTRHVSDSEKKKLVKIFLKCHEKQKHKHNYYSVDLVSLDHSDFITDKEKEYVNQILIKTFRSKEYLKSINQWLSRLDEQREMLAKPNIFDEL